MGGIYLIYVYNELNYCKQYLNSKTMYKLLYLQLYSRKVNEIQL